MNGLEETRRHKLEHLCQASEQGCYIASPFNEEPEMVLIHRSSPPLYLIRGLERNPARAFSYSGVSHTQNLDKQSRGWLQMAHRINVKD